MPGQLSPWNVWWFIWFLLCFSVSLSIYRRRGEFFPHLAEVMVGSRRDRLIVSLFFAVGLTTTLTTLLLLIAVVGLIFTDPLIEEPLPVIITAGLAWLTVVSSLTAIIYSSSKKLASYFTKVWTSSESILDTILTVPLVFLFWVVGKATCYLLALWASIFLLDTLVYCIKFLLGG